jgi:hypothetical protein
LAGRPVRVITSKATLLSRQFRAFANGLYNLMSLLKVRSVLLSLRERSFRSVEISLCSLFMRPPTESPCAFEKPSGWLELWNDGKCVCAAHRQYGQAKDATSVCSRVASVRRGAKGTVTAPLKAFCTPARVSRIRANWAGWLTSQSFCGARRMRAPFAPPRLSVPRKVAAEAQAVPTSSEMESPVARILALRSAMSLASISA